MKIGGKNFRKSTLGLGVIDVWLRMTGGVNYMFTEDRNAIDGPWFGASRCVSGEKKQTLYSGISRVLAIEALEQEIRMMNQ